MQRIYDRREFIGKYFFLNSLIAGAPALLIGCGSKKDSPRLKDANINSNPCEDLSGLSENDLEVRTKAAYTIKSPLPDNLCSNCKLHIPPAAGKECGSCLLFKGPVYPSGYCIYWAPPT
ncbi:MAG: hypothetical protein ABI760_11210 [Ferruginibacter sp.]